MAYGPFNVGGGGSRRDVNATLTAAGWSSDTIPVQSITLTGITADTDGEICLPTAATAAQRAAAREAVMFISGQSANTLTIGCDGTKPTIDIPVVVTIKD